MPAAGMVQTQNLGVAWMGGAIPKRPAIFPAVFPKSLSGEAGREGCK